MGGSPNMHLAAGKNGIDGRIHPKSGDTRTNAFMCFPIERTILPARRSSLSGRHTETNQATGNSEIPSPDSYSFRKSDNPEISPGGSQAYAPGRTSFVSLRPSEKSRTFCRVVCAMLSSASRVKNPWCEVTITLLNDNRRASISSPMIRSEVSS